MELCGSRTLHHYIVDRNSSETPVSKFDASLLLQLTHGLQHVHAAGIVHRDLKPSNCCLSGNTLKLVDFGLSRVKVCTDELVSSSKTWDSDWTQGVGTPSYAAPEQLNGREVTSACDMYPLGLIALELHHPMKTLMEREKLFSAIRRGDDFSSVKLPPIVSRLLEIAPVRRPDCADVIRALSCDPCKDDILLRERIETHILCNEIRLEELKRKK